MKVDGAQVVVQSVFAMAMVDEITEDINDLIGGGWLKIFITHSNFSIYLINN